MKETRAHILATRSVGEKLVREAADHNIVLEEMDFIQIKPSLAPQTESAIRGLLSQPLTAVFTSAHAIRALQSLIEKRPDWKIYCTAEGTRALAEEVFGAGAIAAVAADASLLADKILEKAPEGPVHFFCGNKRRDTLPDKLRESGWELQEWEVYETLLTPTDLSRIYEAVLFFSPSAVESFFSRNRIYPQTRIFAIGNTTAGSLKQFTDQPVFTASRPGKAQLVRQAIELIHSSKTN